MRARPLSTRAVVPLLLLLLVSACRGAAEPMPTTPPPPDPADPDPITLVIEDIHMAPMGNGEILVGTGSAVDPATAERAVEATRAALERYLNAQFVDAETRFTEAPARALLQAGVFDALPPRQKAALGAGHLTVAGVVPQRATGTATVMFEGANAYAVAIDYRAQIDVHVPEADRSPNPDDEDAGVRPLIQEGTVLFTAPSWAVESFEVSTSGVAVPLVAPPPEPAATGTAAAEATP